MSELTFFHIINTKNPSSMLRGLVTWFPKRYTIKMIDESTAYEGEVTVDAMSEYCQSWDKSVEEYIDECKTAFKSDPENSVYSFSIEEERLNIRKLLQDAQSGSTFKAILSSMLLKTVDYSSVVVELLDGALKCNRNYEQMIDTLSRNTSSLRTDYHKMVVLLEEMEKSKLQFESIIYQKFVNLLNAKKEFSHKQRTAVAEKKDDSESEELLDVPRIQNVDRGTIFDAETDSDEVIDEFSTRDSQPCSSTVHTTQSEKSPKNINSTCDSDTRNSRAVESVLSSLAFLDPSVSFLNR